MNVQSVEGKEVRWKFTRLHPQAPVDFAAEACLPLRSRYARCDACQRACPAGVLALNQEALRMEDGCLGCGRCAAVCPTGALAVPGFAPQVAAMDSAWPLTVECWKVPRRLCARGAIRVPCLGGLSVGRWLALRAAAGERPIEVLDRGWCGHCSAGGAIHPAAFAVAQANRLLAEMGEPPQALIRFVHKSLPRKAMPKAIPQFATEASLERRAFFRGLVGQVAQALDAVSTGAHAPGASPRQARWGPLSSPERTRVVSALGWLAKRSARPLPASIFPALRISKACRNHRVCAAICPTGALFAYQEHGVTGVGFDAYACIACGACERACPEKAIGFASQGTGTMSHKPVRLTQVEVRECADCGCLFAERSDDPLCAACRKSRDLARSAFHQLFAART
jgi:ferredoxin